MPLIIDAYNVLHTVGVLPPDIAGIDLAGLARLLQQSRYRGDRVEFVCDGPAPHEHSASSPAPGRGVRTERERESFRGCGTVKVRYAGPGRDADALIARLVRHSTAPRRLIVVSSDQAVLKTARKRRCRTLTSAEFLHQLASDMHRRSGAGAGDAAGAKPPGGLTDRQIDAWLSIFGVESSDESRLTADPPEPAERPATSSPRAERSEPQPRPMSRSGAIVPPDLVREAEELLSESAALPRRNAREVDNTGATGEDAAR